MKVLKISRYYRIQTEVYPIRQTDPSVYGEEWVSRFFHLQIGPCLAR